MKIKMLIVDDEPVICKGLIATIPWKEMGVEVVGTAEHGKEALLLMHQENIDLVLTDVYMPEMNGLELSEYITRKFPESKIIIMSGYDEFEYARQAVRLGVEDYLLKPVNIDDLLKLVEKVRRSIIRQRQNEKLLRKESISKQIFHYLLKSPIAKEDSLDDGKMTMSYRMLISELTDYDVIKRSTTEKEQTELRETWKNQVDQAFSAVGIDSTSIFGHENELIIIPYNIDKAKLTDQQMINVCKSINKVNGYLTRRIVSTQQYRLSDITQLREKIQSILENNRTDGENFIMMGNGLREIKQAIYPEKTASRLQAAILKQDQVLMNDLLEDMFNHFAKKRLTLRQVLNVSAEFVSSLKNRLQEMHYAIHSDSFHFVLSPKVDLKIYNSHHALKYLLKKDMSDLVETLDTKNDHHWIIESAKSYIESNFQQDIKASDVAEEHLITPNYFSMLFKRKTGYSYSEYLNMIRINKASELLIKESNRVYEIAEYVGYKEYKYFAHIFKKQLGITPTEYRRMNVSTK